MLNKLIPDLRVQSIYDIDLKQLQERGIQGIITDLDNTLVGPKEPLATPELTSWLEQVAEQGFKVVVVSNNNETRVAKFSTPLTLPFVSKAKKPTNTAFKKALELLKLSPQQTVMIGDQMLTDVLGGNRLGLYTILVQPITLQDEGFFTKVNRRIEKRAVSRMKKRGLIPWEDES